MASPVLSYRPNLGKQQQQHLPPRPRLSSFSSSFPLRPSARPSARGALRCSNPSSEAGSRGALGPEWPDKKKPLYSHSLPCIESWLASLDFVQSKEDRSLWLVQHPHWHAHLSLDVTDLCIRYLKSGPGTLEKDVERRFKYALSREDIEKAILGGP